MTPEKGRGYLTVGSQSLSGSFAENRLEVSGSAKRELPSPCSCSGTITETVIGRLVERGAGATCEGLPDAGLADAATGASPDVDWAERTFDLFCDGLIVDKFEPSSADCPADVGCPCESGCEARFLLKGVRRGEQILE